MSGHKVELHCCVCVCTVYFFITFPSTGNYDATVITNAMACSEHGYSGGRKKYTHTNELIFIWKLVNKQKIRGR